MSLAQENNWSLRSGLTSRLTDKESDALPTASLFSSNYVKGYSRLEQIMSVGCTLHSYSAFKIVLVTIGSALSMTLTL